MGIGDKLNSLIAGVAANIIGKGEGTSYVYKKGEFYLSINTAQNYTIVIEEKK
jgi:hypothetical protein